jgi:hypothetical protein
MKCRYPGWVLHGVGEVQIGEIGGSELMAGLERTLNRTTAMEQFLERPFMACAVQRRRFPVGESPTRRNAPAGSNRSSHGGNEMAEAFG